MHAAISGQSDHRKPLAEKENEEIVYSIGELAQEFGVTLRTLRFYEDRGMLSPKRIGGARFYREADRTRLDTILKGKQLGFTLSEIRTMLEEHDGGKAGLNLSLAIVEQQLKTLEDQKRTIEKGLTELQQTRDRLLAARAGNGRASDA